jgi:hypothetical protein
MLVQGQVHGRLERGELALSLGGGGLAEIFVARTQVDVRGVEESKHAERVS